MAVAKVDLVRPKFETADRRSGEGRGGRISTWTVAIENGGHYRAMEPRQRPQDGTGP